MGLLFLNLMLNQFFLSTCFFTTLFIPVVWRFSYLSYDWGKEIWAYGFLRMLFKFPFNIHLFLVNRIHVNGTSTNTNPHCYFGWFLSSLELVLNFEFCLQKLFIFYQKLLWNIRSRLNSSTFWFFRPVSRFKLKLSAQKILIKHI